MSRGTLDFWQPRHEQSLEFSPVPPVTGTLTLTISVSFSALSAAIDLRTLASISVSAAFGALSATASMLWDADAPRGPSSSVRSPWAQPVPLFRSMQSHTAPSDSMQHATRLSWQDALALGVDVRVATRATEKNQHVARFPWAQALRMSASGAVETAAPNAATTAADVPWAQALRVSASAQSEQAFPEPVLIADGVAWRDAHKLSIMRDGGWRAAACDAANRRAPWQSAKPPLAGIGAQRPVIPSDGKQRPRGSLDFRCLRLHDELRMGRRQCLASAPMLVKIRDTYMINSAASLTRLSDGADIPTYSMSLSIDADSWAWGFSAVIDYEAVALIAPRTELRAIINGYEWRVVCDSPSHTRQFAGSSARITGRSLGAWLAAPYAPTRSYVETVEKTAQQLAAQELPTGWLLDWQIMDWIVPAGALQYESLCPIDVIARIASAVGGYVQCHPWQRIIHVLPRYPDVPWKWGEHGADATLPAAFVDSVNGQEVAAIDATGAVASGIEPHGAIAIVTRLGTPGDVLTNTVQDDLLTDATSAIARATHELARAQTYTQRTLSIDLAQPPNGAGIVLPGTMLDLDDAGWWRGIVLGCSVSVSADQGGLITATQQAEVHSYG